jgi:hypothetical protein
LGGKIIKIKYGIVFESFSPVFENFVNYFNDVKKKNDGSKFFGKLIINSLYGRLGMDESSSYSFFINQKDFEIYNNKFKILKRRPLNDMDFIEIELTKKAQNDLNLQKQKIRSNVSIAAAITSKARIKLMRAQLAVIKNEGRLLYSDTDSIFAAYKRDVSNEKHGEIFWDVSKTNTILSDAVFIAPKTYGYKINNESIIKIKGASHTNISFEDLKAAFYKNEEFTTISNLFVIYKHNFLLKSELESKRFALNYYDKRKFVDDKKNTKPFFFDNFVYK